MQWTPELKNCLTLHYKVPARTKVTLLVEAWDEDIGFADDLIGLTEVDVSHMVEPGASNCRLLCALMDESQQEQRGTIVITASAESIMAPYVDVDWGRCVTAGREGKGGVCFPVGFCAALFSVNRFATALWVLFSFYTSDSVWVHMCPQCALLVVGSTRICDGGDVVAFDAAGTVPCHAVCCLTASCTCGWCLASALPTVTLSRNKTRT